MNFQGVEICCPFCRGDLTERDAGERLCCEACGRDFPVILGIPDLRIFPDPYIDIAADRAKGIKVGQQLELLSFRDLVAYYYSVTDVVPPHHARQYTQGLLTAANRAQVTLSAWQAELQPQNSTGPTLEIGCGTGPLLATAAAEFRQVVGVDIAFRWLVVAKKRLAEAGVTAPLICACAEALPFPDDSFNLVLSESTIEHVADQEKVMAESYRVMRSGGQIFLTTPNRYCPGPDPQVGIWGGTWLPESWLAAIVRRQGGIPPRRQLLSARSLERLLRRAGYGSSNITLPEIAPEQKANFRPPLSWLIELYNRGRLIFPLRRFLLWLGPLLNASAHKAGRGSD